MENCVRRKELDAKCVHFEPNIKEQLTLEKNGTFLKSVKREKNGDCKDKIDSEGLSSVLV